MSTSTTNEIVDLDVLTKDVAALKGDIGRLIENMKNSATDAVSNQTQRLYDSIASEGKRSAALLARQMEERPLRGLLIAFAVGFVGGQILRR